MAELNGRPLAVHALALAAAPVFAGRIAVTRSAEVEALCRAGGFPVLRHAEPRRSDTVRLGLTALLAQQPDLQGCVFLPGDQPCLTRQTLEALAIGAAPDTIRRPAAPDGTPGSPVLFGRDYFAALLHLPEGCGGSAVLRAHPAGDPPAAHPRRRAAGHRHPAATLRRCAGARGNAAFLIYGY